MSTFTKLREKLRELFDEGDSNKNKNIRIWPFVVWLFISEIAGFYGRFLVPSEYHLIMGLGCAMTAGALLYKPLSRLCIKKQSNKS